MSDRGYILTGWWLFVVCAVFFIAAALRAGDWVALAGACFFMAANIVFLVPLYRRGPDE